MYTLETKKIWVALKKKDDSTIACAWSCEDRLAAVDVLKKYYTGEYPRALEINLTTGDDFYDVEDGYIYRVQTAPYFYRKKVNEAEDNA